MENDSAAAALFNVWFGRFGRTLFSKGVSDEMAAAIRNPNQLIVLDMVDNPQKWFDSDPEGTVANAVLESLAAAVGVLEERFGTNPSSWRYGEYNRMGLEHPLSGAVDAATRARIDIAPEEKCSAGGTVGTTNASWRQILDVGNWDAAIAMSNPGQSGDPDSPFYRNLWNPWRNCEAFPLLYSREKIEAETRIRIRLVPE
jgi:penicillin amidase